MAAVTNLNTGGNIQNKIFSDSRQASCSYGNVRQKVYVGTIPANSTVQLADVCKLKAPDTVMLELLIAVFATDGTNSSQVFTVYNSINQLVSGGAIFISVNTNDVLININNGVASPTPMTNISYLADPTNNSVICSINTLAGSQQRPCRYTATFTQYSSIPY